MHGSYIARPMMSGNLQIRPGGRYGHSSPSPASRFPSPKGLAGAVIENLRRPSRLRGRLGIVFAVGLLMVVALGARIHSDDIQNYVLTTIPMPSYLTSSHWTGSPISTTKLPSPNRHPATTAARPKFHLLIPAQNASLNLCKTLFSAAILNYPPPTLIGYHNPSAALIEDTLRWLTSREAHDDDLALIVDTHTWFQLPAQVLVDRYAKLQESSTAALLPKYSVSPSPSNPSSSAPPEPEPRYKTSIFFPATKHCGIPNNSPDTSAASLCGLFPESTLPTDIYGESTDFDPMSDSVRPRYLQAGTHMGRVSDMRTMYTAAFSVVQSSARDDDVAARQDILSTLFAAQSFAREKARRAAKGAIERFSAWLYNVADPMDGDAAALDMVSPSLKFTEAANLGIAVDYGSTLFQSVEGAKADVHFVRFNDPTVIASPSRLAAETFRGVIRLPKELRGDKKKGPFRVVGTSGQNKQKEKENSMEKLPLNRGWGEVGLATNVVVPGAGVPAALHFGGEGMAQEVKWWGKMWWAGYGRALLRRYLRSSGGVAEADRADRGGVGWWDLRGGRGGVWTDGGEFLEWGEVCGGWEGVVLRDGRRLFGREDVVEEGAEERGEVEGEGTE